MTQPERPSDAIDSPRQPIRRRPLHDEATERLRDMIVEGRLAAGDWINESELCQQLQISRTPLREALKILASEGLIDLLPRRGARVARLGVREIVDLFEALSGIERIAAELAATRTSAADLDKLRELQGRIEEHYRARDRHEYFRENQNLHEAIVSLSGNSVLIDMHARLIARVRRARFQAILSEERWRESVREHADILAALESRQARRAGDLMRAHVAQTGDIVRASLEAPSALAEPEDVAEHA
jgi:DNA-binding GntR family transcriptional regulator